MSTTERSPTSEIAALDDAREVRDILMLLPERMRSDPLAYIAFRPLMRRTLARHGCTTIADVISMPDADILALHDVGPHVLDDFRESTRSFVRKAIIDETGSSDDVSRMLSGRRDDLMDAPLDGMSLKPAVMDVLSSAGLATVGDLKDDAHLLGIPGLGPSRLKSLKRALFRFILRAEAGTGGAGRSGPVSIVRRYRTSAADYGILRGLMAELSAELAGFEQHDRWIVESVLGLRRPPMTMADIASQLHIGTRQNAHVRYRRTVTRIGGMKLWGLTFPAAIDRATEGYTDPVSMKDACGRDEFLSGLDRHPNLFWLLVREYMGPSVVCDVSGEQMLLPTQPTGNSRQPEAGAWTEGDISADDGGEATADAISEGEEIATAEHHGFEGRDEATAAIPGSPAPSEDPTVIDALAILPMKFRASSLSVLPIRWPTLGILMRHGLKVVDDLRSDDFLEGLRGIGGLRLSAIREALWAYCVAHLRSEGKKWATPAVQAPASRLLDELHADLRRLPAEERLAVEFVAGLRQGELLESAQYATWRAASAAEVRAYGLLEGIACERGWTWRFPETADKALADRMSHVSIFEICAVDAFLSGLERTPRLFAFLVRRCLDKEAVAREVLHVDPRDTARSRGTDGGQ